MGCRRVSRSSSLQVFVSTQNYQVLLKAHCCSVCWNSFPKVRFASGCCARVSGVPTGTGDSMGVTFSKTLRFENANSRHERADPSPEGRSPISSRFKSKNRKRQADIKDAIAKLRRTKPYMTLVQIGMSLSANGPTVRLRIGLRENSRLPHKRSLSSGELPSTIATNPGLSGNEINQLLIRL